MIYIDDSIMQKGCPATAGSKMLENFIAPFDATVVTRLKEKTARVRLSEFGLSENGELRGTPMLCNDVFGNVRCRAVKQGLCYIRPTYGTISRFGLIPMAASMDQIGVVCKNPSEGFSLLSAVAGYDTSDGAMFPEKNYRYEAEKREIRYGSLPASEIFGMTRQVLDILAYAEISGNISRYDGIKFGYHASNYKDLDDLYIKNRTEGFGLETKLAAVMGCLILSRDYYVKYYEKAMKIRRLIRESLHFDQYDIISIPVDDPLAVLVGLPSLSFSHNGTGVQLAADIKKENLLLTAWEAR